MEAIIPMIALGGLAYSMGEEPDKTKTKQRTRTRDKPAEGYTNMNRGNTVPGSVPDSYPVPQQQQRGQDIQQRKSDPYATHAHTSSNTAAAKYFVRVARI